MYEPYTYLIGWTKLNKWYYGVRWQPDCNPSDFWNEYFTSSNYVKMFRDVFGDPDVIEIRKTFDNPEAARRWEGRVISKLDMYNDKKWLNRVVPIRMVPLDELIEYRRNGETYETIAKRYGITRQAVHYRLTKKIL